MNSLYGTPLTGMRAADFQLEVVANNIANVNTSGFETVEPVVADLPSQDAIGPDMPSATLPATRVGMGARPAATERSQTSLPLTATGNPLDLAIEGNGYFALRDQNGRQVYSRQVSLHLEPDGQLATAQGLTLSPPIRVGADVMAVHVNGQGQLTGETRTGQQVSLGNLAPVTFPAPENLRALGGGAYAASLSSGRPGVPAAGSARVMSGYQLGSGVDLSTEMVEMIQAQRMYELNGKALQTLDSLVSGAINMQSR